MSNLSVEPQSILKLLRCGLQKDSGHQLTFNNTTLQETYFTGKVLLSYTDFTYIRESNAVVVGDNIETVRSCNYMMFQNKGFNTKWFYAFIDRVEYVNENATRVYFTIDCWQTYMHDFDYHPVFVEREHTNDDSIGANRVPETIATGDYICLSEDYYTGFNKYVFVVQTTAPYPAYNGNPADPDTWPFPSATNYGGFPMSGGAYVTRHISGVDYLCKAYMNSSDANVKNAIYNIYAVPEAFISVTLPDDPQGGELTPPASIVRYHGQTQPSGTTKSITKPSTSIGTYTNVRNNKLFTYPYVYLLVSNNNGVSNVYRFEDWYNSSTAKFRLAGVPAVGGSIKVTPNGYGDMNEENGIIAGKFPVYNWQDDSYTNWLTQNAVNQKLDVISTIGSMLGSGGYGLDTSLGDTQPTGMGMGNAIGNIVSGAARIGKIVQNDRVHQMQAPSASTKVNGGDINVCDKTNGIYFYTKSITPEMARVIDDYFTMYGYQTNKLKNPNVIGRQNWNYVKTIGCDFDARNVSNMPPEAEKEIQKMFDNGVTFWHNPATMYDYTQSNNIVTP